MEDPETHLVHSCVDFYFLEQVRVQAASTYGSAGALFRVVLISSLLAFHDTDSCSLPLPAKDGSTFKATMPYMPYFYLGIRPNRAREVEGWLQRKFESLIHAIEPIQRVDLEMVR